MKKFWLLLIVLGNMLCLQAQQYKSHKVEKGDNVYRLAKRYNTTEEAIYKINPDAKDGIKEGEVLAIPISGDEEYKTHLVKEDDTAFNISKRYNVTLEQIFEWNPEAKNGIQLGQVLRVGLIDKNEDTIATENVKDLRLDTILPEPEEKKVIRFRTHKVKRKETLWGIAQEYNITIDDIKKYNKRLYSEQVKKKDRLRIPVYEEGSSSEIAEYPKDRLSKTTKYSIQPKDTKFSIARRHGITVEEFEQLNPGLDPNLPIGTEIIVPTTIFIPYEKETLQPGFELYRVPPKETMFNLVRKLDIPADSLLKMNPYIKDGLKEGMVITIPKRAFADSLAIDYAEGASIDLSSKLYNFKPKKIALMLPFGLDTLKLGARKNMEEFMKSRKAIGVRVAADFYRGALIAIDSAKTRGLTTEVNIYDTGGNNNVEKVKELIMENNIQSMDAVIGPLYQANVEAVAEALKSYEVPVFSPISKKESKLYGNFFQTRPTDEMLRDRVVSYVKKDSATQKNIVLIIQNGQQYEAVKKKLTAEFPNAKIAKVQEGNFVYEIDLLKALNSKMPNWVFLESKDVALISNATTLLNAKADKYNITLFTTEKTTAFDDEAVRNEHLSKLHLHYPSIDKEVDNDTIQLNKGFLAQYQKLYKAQPSKYAVRGFDITYDILMRLGTADDLYHSATFEGTTEYVESKFNYAKKAMGGYYNKASYLIRFEDDLKLKVIE